MGLEKWPTLQIGVESETLRELNTALNLQTLVSRWWFDRFNETSHRIAELGGDLKAFVSKRSNQVSKGTVDFVRELHNHIERILKEIEPIIEWRVGYLEEELV